MSFFTPTPWQEPVTQEMVAWMGMARSRTSVTQRGQNPLKWLESRVRRFVYDPRVHKDGSNARVKVAKRLDRLALEVFEGDGLPFLAHPLTGKRGRPKTKNTPEALAQFLGLPPKANEDVLAVFQRWMELLKARLNLALDKVAYLHGKFQTLEPAVLKAKFGELFLPLSPRGWQQGSDDLRNLPRVMTSAEARKLVEKADLEELDPPLFRPLTAAEAPSAPNPALYFNFGFGPKQDSKVGSHPDPSCFISDVSQLAGMAAPSSSSSSTPVYVPGTAKKLADPFAALDDMDL